MTNTASIGKLAEVFLSAHGSKDEVLRYCEFVHDFLKFNFQTIKKERLFGRPINRLLVS